MIFKFGTKGESSWDKANAHAMPAMPAPIMAIFCGGLIGSIVGIEDEGVCQDSREIRAVREFLLA